MTVGEVACDFVIETFIRGNHDCRRINGVNASRQEVDALASRKGVVIYWNPEKMDYIGGRWVGRKFEGGIN